MERMSFFLALPEELIIKIAHYLGTGLGECGKNLNLYGVSCFYVTVPYIMNFTKLG